MSNQYWNHPPDNNRTAQKDGTGRPGGLLRKYSEQHRQASPQYAAPSAGQAPQGAPPHSPLPPAPSPQQQNWSAPQAGASPSFFANAMQTVRRLSGKMAAMRGGSIDQRPLMLYHPPSQPLPARPQPWKRSRSMHIAMQMRHRRQRWMKSHPSNTKIS